MVTAWICTARVATKRAPQKNTKSVCLSRARMDVSVASMAEGTESGSGGRSVIGADHVLDRALPQSSLFDATVDFVDATRPRPYFAALQRKEAPPCDAC